MLIRLQRCLVFGLATGFLSGIALHGASLATRVTSAVSAGVWSYTVYNDQPVGSTIFVDSVTVLVNSSITVVNTPPGWSVDTDNRSYVFWFNADSTLPYIHDVAPGNSLSGFAISSSATASALSSAIVPSWDHAQDLPGPLSGALSVNAPGNPPFGSFDTPVNDSTRVTGAVPVTGWALDTIQVRSVGIYREPPAGQGTALLFVDNAVFVQGARPDVAIAFPTYPFKTQAGWGVEVLTNELPNGDGSAGVGNGTYTLHAIAVNNAGESTDLGTKTIVVDNAHARAPFGTIDTPAQGAVASGNAYVNFGWVLTPNVSNIIPLDGSTISVFIDGMPMGHPVYNNYRGDIATLFPGLQNTNGAIGYYYIDTTKLVNGVHTIAWGVTDSAGNAQGIGSRYFTVQN